MAVRRYDEETLTDLAFLLFGGATMTAGFIVGIRIGDKGLVIGTALVVLLIFYTSRNTLIPLLRKDRSVLSLLKKNKKKARAVQLLSVVDQDNRNRIGLLEVERGRFYPNDRLRIFALYSVRGSEGEGMKIFVVDDKGREIRAGTVRVRNGNFTKGQRLRVESTEVR